MALDLVSHLLATLPDEPRWVDVRGMLRSGHARVTGGTDPSRYREADHGFVVSVLHGAVSVVGIVGRPPARAIADAVDGVTAMTPVVAQTDDGDWVDRCLRACSGPEGEWRGERTIAHRLREGLASTPSPGDAEVRLLTASDSLAHLPAGLLHEMTHAASFAPIAAAFADGRPVTFCYPVWRTETLWDVSIDTLEGYRRRGLAVQAVRLMAEHLARERLSPVWCAIASNEPSRRLAARLGFEEVASFVVFSRGPWAILSGGFTG